MARLPYLGPAIVVVGSLVAGVGAWYFVHARPKPGAVIDTIDLGNDGRLVVRSEAGGERAFLERHDRQGLQWQALVPHYAGTRDRRAVAWSTFAVTVRVQRGGRSEVFALAMEDGRKLGGRRLAPDREPNTAPTSGPITITDHALSYEFVSGPDWHRVVGIDLSTGNVAWKIELGSIPVTDGRIDRPPPGISLDQGTPIQGSQLRVTQRDQMRTFDAATGTEVSPR